LEDSVDPDLPKYLISEDPKEPKPHVPWLLLP